MKKIFLSITLIAVIFVTGCGNLNDQKIKDDFIKDVQNLKSYYLEGELSLTNNDDNYKYDVEVSYKKDNNYKVVLTNQANDYQQIILKNNQGVYVITPSLNKSFKFQSTWPNNNSQSYLLESVANDLKNDKDYKFEQKNNEYIFQTKTNYPNNPQYVKQNIILDKNYDLKEVEVLDDKDIPYVEFYVKNLDKKPTFSDDYFELETITKSFDITEQNKPLNEQEEQNKPIENNEQQEESKEPEENKSEETMSVDDSVFPLYLPSNTALSNKEVIKTENGERLIMTFTGEKPFILVQETVSKEDELTIIPTYGEPFLLIDTVGSLTDVSYTWTSKGIEYYIASDVMQKEELLEVAKSLNVVATISEK